MDVSGFRKTVIGSLVLTMLAAACSGCVSNSSVWQCRGRPCSQNVQFVDKYPILYFGKTPVHSTISHNRSSYPDGAEYTTWGYMIPLK